MRPYREQFDRMVRCRDAIASLASVQARDSSKARLAYEDALLFFFQNAWHLKDWIRHDPTIPQPLRDALVSQVETVPELLICADLCNGSKHLSRTTHRVGADFSMLEVEMGRATNHLTLEQYVDLPDGTRFAARDAADVAVRVWEGILRRHGLLSPTEGFGLDG
jgi:hypothetical protein